MRPITSPPAPSARWASASSTSRDARRAGSSRSRARRSRCARWRPTSRRYSTSCRRRRLRRRRQLVEYLREVGRQRAHLLLLALERDEPALLASLDVEDALAHRADGAGGEVIRRIEAEGRAHGRPSDARSPSIAFIVSTLSPSKR